MKDYFFYKIVCNDLHVKHTYVGSTENFTIRKSAHKTSSTNPKKAHMKIYATMASTGGWSNWEMVLIESRRFGTRLEAKQLERFHYEQLNREFALNMIFPCRDAAEYYENNKDAFVVKNKNYREANKDAIAAYKKDYNEANKDAIAARCHVNHNCVCGGRYTHSNLQNHMKTNKHTAYIAQIKK
jgi:hypothetical protein